MKNRQELPKLPSPKRTVNVISGGEEINGVMYTAAKKVSKITVTHGKRVRQVLEEDSITFDDADADGVLTPHNDTLGTYTAREARMQQYLEKARDLVRQFQAWKVTQIPREDNAEADALAYLASSTEVPNEENASVIHLFHSVLDQDKNEYGILPEDKKKAQALHQKAARYCLNQGNLYRKMFGGPLARCLGPSQTESVMKEIHEGHCGNHAEGRSLVKTIIRVGYYWLKMEEAAENFVAKCDKYQRYGNNMHRPAELLHPVVAPWPFMKWGIGIVGLLPQAKGKVRFLLILIDYFTKWVKAGAFKQCSKNWRHIPKQQRILDHGISQMVNAPTEAPNPEA
uniref:Uncharacterized protein LOC104213053 n=1 Tax=Nicotiana sylvestris TaxID=4096 RepID=A0A1U7UXJ2_NICSY|nr:PREDICTED: uncharacterized protein LOC104213053 [Nicotiana sylvestris]